MASVAAYDVTGCLSGCFGSPPDALVFETAARAGASPGVWVERARTPRTFAITALKVEAVAAGSEDAMGWGMMTTANSKPDPWSGRTYTGFRPGLVAGQGSDVYRHLVGYSGAVLATKTGGGFVANFKFAEDVWQWLRGKPGAAAEVADDLAGGAVGAVMLLGRGNVSRVTRQVTRIVCQ